MGKCFGSTWFHKIGVNTDFDVVSGLVNTDLLTLYSVSSLVRLRTRTHLHGKNVNTTSQFILFFHSYLVSVCENELKDFSAGYYTLNEVTKAVKLETGQILLTKLTLQKFCIKFMIYSDFVKNYDYLSGCHVFSHYKIAGMNAKFVLLSGEGVEYIDMLKDNYIKTALQIKNMTTF